MIGRLHKLTLGTAMLALAGCGGYGYGDARYPVEPAPVLTSITLSLAETVVEVGQSLVATASARDQFDQPFDAGPVTFASSAPEVAGINSVDGRILAISAGTTTITARAGGKSASRTLTVSFPPLFINEVEPLGASDAGWVELFNPTAKPVSLAGWTVTNGNLFQPAALPADAIVPAGGFFVIDERTFPAGLKERDAVHLFSRFGVQSDAFAWGHNPETSFGRCPDGQSGLVETTTPTKGAANACPLP